MKAGIPGVSGNYDSTTGAGAEHCGCRTTPALFYADAAGTPGTDLTFFPRRGMAPGRRGVGQVS